MAIEEKYYEVLEFWFEELDEKMWFQSTDQLDEEIQVRFGATHRQAAAGELWEWRETVEGRLAEVIVLDQFSRNIHRGRSEAFASDGMALILAQEALRHKAIYDLETKQRAFLYMPFMHSESLVIHEVAMTLFKEKGMESFYKYEKEHRDVIAMFGRYPHRNAVLNRPSTKKELEFLKQHKGF